MKTETIITVLLLVFFSMAFLSSEIRAQKTVESPQQGDRDIQISDGMLRRLGIPEGATVVMPKLADATRELESAIKADPFDSFNWRELANSLSVALRSDFLTEYLQLQETQKKKLSEILESHQARVTDLFAEAKKATDPDIAFEMYSIVSQEKVAFCRSIKEQLTVSQQTNFPFCRSDYSAPKLLLKSKLGYALELTEAQKQQILTQSEKLVRELEKFLQAKRQESEKILAGALTETQLNLLKEVRGEKGVTDNSEAPFNKLMKDYTIE